MKQEKKIYDFIKNRYWASLITVLFAIIILSSCKSQYEILLNSHDVNAKYEAAFDYYNNKKYSKAAALFESMSVLTNGTHRDDTVRYYWGLSNYKAKDYYTAEANFTSFIESFPRSPFTSDARFLRIDCMYRSTHRYELDQIPTYKAISSISEYILDFPDTPHMKECNYMLKDLNHRLDQKAYEGAKLYYKMEDYLAARVALRNVLKEDSENDYREDIMYYIAMASYKYAHLSVPSKQKERYLVFVDDCLNFFGEFPESSYTKELTSVYAKAQKALGRRGDDTIIPDIDRKEERLFAKERAKLERERKKAERLKIKAEKKKAKEEAK